MKQYFIQTKVKIDYCQWLKEDQTGAFQDKSLGSATTYFYKQKTKELLKDQKVIDRIASIYENKVQTVGSPMIQKFFR